MLNEYPSVYDLIDGVKGTTRALSILISRKAGVVIAVIIVSAIVSKIFLG
jgi:hypothetical protein